MDRKALAHLWSEADKHVAVWYYDSNAAAAGGVTEEEMMAYAF